LHSPSFHLPASAAQPDGSSALVSALQPSPITIISIEPKSASRSIAPENSSTPFSPAINRQVSSVLIRRLPPPSRAPIPAAQLSSSFRKYRLPLSTTLP